MKENDDDSLFVDRAGQVDQTRNFIDLTEETEEEAAARALRVAAIPWDLRPIKKEEPDSQAVPLPAITAIPQNPRRAANTSSSGIVVIKEEDDEEKPIGPVVDDETDNEDAIEAIEDQLGFQRRSLERLERKQNPRNQDFHGAQIANLRREIRKLEEHLQRRLAKRKQAEPAEGDRSISAERRTVTNDSGINAEQDVTSPDPTANKKRTRSGTRTKNIRVRKNAAAGGQIRRRKKMPKDDLLGTIRKLVLGEDSIEAGKRMAELPVLEAVNATTVAEFEQLMKEITRRFPEEEREAIRWNINEIADARGPMGRKAKMEGSGFKIPKLRSILYLYQFATVGWMVRRENSEAAPYGGLLADATGLGKTVEMLACIARNEPSEQDLDDCVRTTLIVAPANLVGQWVDEIAKHCEPEISVYAYKRSDVIGQAAHDRCTIL